MNTNIKLSLDTRRKKKDNTFPIILRLSHFRKTTSIRLGVSVQLNFWDESGEKIKKPYSDSMTVKKLNNKLLKAKVRAINIIDQLNEKEELNYLSISQIKNKITKKVTVNSFFEYSNSIIEDLKKVERYGNANSYYAITKILKKFNNENDLKFNEVNYEFLKKFEQFHYSRGNSTNGLAVYMKTIRAIYNKAIKSGLVSKESYPFVNYKIKTTPTEKRALDINSIKSIMLLKLDKSDNLFHFRNYFLASYMLYGVSFIDMAFLKLENIIDNRIKFFRSKTSKPYDIKITAPLKEILDFYTKDKEKSDFIFPIIKRDTYELQYKDVLWARKVYNKGLKQIAEKCNIEQRVTSYVSRHSFATQAMLQDVPLLAISAMLGHNRLTTTQIYLKSLPSEVLDDYNKKLVQF
ncbi:tyrosine-type recombinase/integrase [Changchengzhania lutea]|uniref:tyrosine-type recombinase/integrase n=1 Tax=Changchengzhania lutea TaxID=2049305 RepID=UPI00115E9BB4|nr:site-specific integrase [Changchengzhania lutea]